MKRFQFSLQPILHLRIEAKKIAMQELAVAVANVESVNSKIEELQRVLPTSESADRTTVSVTSLARASRSRQHLQNEIERHREELLKAEEQLNACRQTLVEKSREVLVLEKLRERRHAEFVRRSSATAQAVLSESLATKR